MTKPRRSLPADAARKRDGKRQTKQRDESRKAARRAKHTLNGRTR